MRKLSLGVVAKYTKGIKPDSTAPPNPTALAIAPVAFQVPPATPGVEAAYLRYLLALFKASSHNSSPETMPTEAMEGPDNPSSPERYVAPVPEVQTPPPVLKHHFYALPSPPRNIPPFSVDAAIKEIRRDAKDILQMKLMAKIHQATIEEIGDNFWEYDAVCAEKQRKHRKMISWLKKRN